MIGLIVTTLCILDAIRLIVAGDYFSATLMLLPPIFWTYVAEWQRNRFGQ